MTKSNFVKTGSIETVRAPMKEPVQKLPARVRLVAASAFALSLLAGAASADETIEYEYDVHGRLVKVERCGADNNCAATTDNIVTDYEYDDADNRTNEETVVPP